MKQWIEVDAATRRVLGYVRSGKATTLPAAPKGRELIEVSDLQLAEYETLSEQSRSDGRGDGVLYTGGFALPADTRPYIDIVVDLNHRVSGNEHVGEVLANGIDTAILTFIALNADGSVRRGLNASRRMQLDDRIVKLDFTAGVATKNFKTRRGSRLRIFSDNQVKLKAPFSIDPIVSGDLED